MSFIVWRDAFTVGNQLIDYQHKQLVAMLNDLHAELMRGNGTKALLPVLDNLLRYTRTHFATEERLMASMSYPRLAEHKREHAELAAQVANFIAGARAGKTSVTVQVLGFLKNWLQDHILSSDQEYALHLRRSHAKLQQSALAVK